MNFTGPQSTRCIRYPRHTVERAERAVRCAAFQLPLFVTMQRQSVALRAIAGKTGVRNGYLRRPLAELAVEDRLMWLIQVGVLRREVDGQGITDSFRLTPLGHQLVEKWQQGGSIPTASWIDRLQNLFSRWVRLPSWIQ
jgi:hypothetical protein